MKIRSKSEERGFVTIEVIGVMLLSLVILIAATNIIILQYARGVVRGALDEGVRDGARSPTSDLVAEQVCTTRVQQSMSTGLGTLRSQITTPPCFMRGNQMVATANYNFQLILPVSQTWNGQLSASSRRERDP